METIYCNSVVATFVADTRNDSRRRAYNDRDVVNHVVGKRANGTLAQLCVRSAHICAEDSGEVQYELWLNLRAARGLGNGTIVRAYSSRLLQPAAQNQARVDRCVIRQDL